MIQRKLLEILKEKKKCYMFESNLYFLSLFLKKKKWPTPALTVPQIII